MGLQYSLTSLKRVEPLVDHHIEEWTERLGELFADTGKRCYFSRWALWVHIQLSSASYPGPKRISQLSSF